MRDDGEEKLRKEINKIYTPLSEAKKEIHRRWNDKELRKKVGDFLGDDIPQPFKEGPKSIFARHIASPNYELLRFIELSKIMKVESVCLEFLNDRFVAGNACKYHLCKMFFNHGIGKKWGPKLSTLNIINFEGAEGKRISDLKTLNNTSLVNFHHNLMRMMNVDVHRFDIGDWYIRNGEIPEKYYDKFFALLICHGIMFENYLLNDEEYNFVDKIILKKFHSISKQFGLKPLIVPLLPFETESDVSWYFYPSSMKSVAEKYVIK